MNVSVPHTRAIGLPWLLLSVLTVASCAHGTAVETPPSSPSPLLGQGVPTFARPSVQGPTYDTSETRARLLVIQFFAAYCQPCQRALPALQALRAKHPDVEVVGVSLDDTPEGALRMVGRHRLTFPVVHDNEHILAGRFHVTELPASFIADDRGRIIWTADPAQPEDALTRTVAALAGAPK
jgi:peroxiredoxin